MRRRFATPPSGLPGGLPLQVYRGIDEDPKEPGFVIGPPYKAIKASVGLEADLLDQVLRLVAVLELLNREAIQGVQVRSRQRLELLPSSRLCCLSPHGCRLSPTEPQGTPVA